MATLTNTKIKDTYVGLLKTTDNEAIDAAGVTLLEDGAGNASALSVGRASNGVTITGTATATAFAGPLTGNVIGNVTGDLTGTVLTAAQTNITSVGTLSSLAVSGNLTVDTDTLYVAAAANRVGVGTSSPDTRFHVNSGGTQIGSLFESTSAVSTQINIKNANSTLGGFIKTTGDNIILTANNTGAEHLVVADGGNVGINTSSPATELDIAKDIDAKLRITSTKNGTFVEGDNFGSLEFYGKDTSGLGEGIRAAIRAKAQGTVGVNTDLTFSTSNGSTGLDQERMRINSSGNVGIGKSLPTVALDVVGQVRASTGILFGSDTAAANALDDYEEGTWTPVYTTDDGDFDTIDYSIQEGNYTKIGRVVYCDLFVRGGNITYSGAVTSSSDVRIGGLPFTAIGGLDSPGASISYLVSWANTNNPNAVRLQPGTTQINLHQLRDTANVYTIKVSDLNSGAANTLNDIRMSFFYNVP